MYLAHKLVYNIDVISIRNRISDVVDIAYIVIDLYLRNIYQDDDFRTKSSFTELG